MYMKVVGKYSYDKYHEANEEKLRLFGPVVREDVIWKYPLIHLFDSEVELMIWYDKCISLTNTTLGHHQHSWNNFQVPTEASQ